MIRIVGVQRSGDPADEFVLLQNQGAMRVNLRGHAVAGEVAVELGRVADGVHLFPDEVEVLPGMYVMLTTGPCESGWFRTREGMLVFRTSMGRNRSMWQSCPGALLLLSPQHTYVERRREALLV